MRRGSSGSCYFRTGRADDAIETYEAALEYAPGDANLKSKLADWQRQSQLHDRFRQSSGTHFRVLFEGRSDEALARRIVEMLETAYRNVGGVLRTYPAQTITVVLYTQQQFQDITRAPAWSAGVYDGQIRLPVRGALERRDEIQRVLTHEFVHALVANLGGRTVPMWLHDGLATALEQGGWTGPRGCWSQRPRGHRSKTCTGALADSPVTTPVSPTRRALLLSTG